MNLRHILLTTDLSDESMHPCQPVADFARATGARLTLLNVVEDVRVAPHGAPLAPPIAPFDTEKQKEQAREALEALREKLGTDLEVSVDVVADQKIAQAVATYADEHDVDLIALSTHGRTGFRHLALGSVAEAILRHAKVPVLSFPQPK